MHFRSLRSGLRYIGLCWLMMWTFGCAPSTDVSITGEQELEVKQRFTVELTRQGELTTTQRDRILKALVEPARPQTSTLAPKTNTLRDISAAHLMFGTVLILFIISLFSLFHRLFTVMRVKYLSMIGGLASLMVASIWAPPELASYAAFAGCLALSIGFIITIVCEHPGSRLFYLRYKKHELVAPISLGVLSILWSAAAIYFQSSLNGFMAVMAGFMMLVFFLINDEFDEDVFSLLPFWSPASRVTALGFGMVGLYAMINGVGGHLLWLQPFKLGALYQGACIGYMGLLLMSSSWWEDGLTYWVMQFITPLLCVGSIALGDVEGFEFVRQCGGSALVLFVLIKIMDTYKQGAIFFFTTMCVGTLVGLFALADIIQRPELYAPYLFFV